MRIFLIANNTNIYYNKIKKFNNTFIIDDNDKIIRFNDCKQLNILNGKTTDVIFRCSNNGFQGIDNNFMINNKYIRHIKKNINISMIMWVDEPLSSQNKKISEMKKIQKYNNIKIHNIIPLSKDNKKITGKSPSSGFAVLLYYLKKFNDAEIILLGFTFYNGVNNWHNFAGEIYFINRIMQKTNRIKIFN